MASLFRGWSDQLSGFINQAMELDYWWTYRKITYVIRSKERRKQRITEAYQRVRGRINRRFQGKKKKEL